MNLLKLRLSMLGTLTIIIGVSTLGLATLLSLMGSFNIYSLIIVVAVFNIAQWLLAPYLINSLYGVRKLDHDENPELHKMIKELSARSGIRLPKLMLSNILIPNAFAYGSPLTGNHVAVTKGLLDNLETEEVEAVIGHELGHIKHRDVQVMMFISFLPSLFYFLARTTMFSSYYGQRNRRDSGGLAAIGALSMVIYFFLIMFNLGLSRLREYFADQHASEIVQDGARKLSEGLAKISTATARAQKTTPQVTNVSDFKALFISDPDRAIRDADELEEAKLSEIDEELVRSIVSRKISNIDRLIELFSTHPNIVKRIRVLQG